MSEKHLRELESKINGAILRFNAKRVLEGSELRVHSCHLTPAWLIKWNTGLELIPNRLDVSPLSDGA